MLFQIRSLSANSVNKVICRHKTEFLLGLESWCFVLKPTHSARCWFTGSFFDFATVRAVPSEALSLDRRLDFPWELALSKVWNGLGKKMLAYANTFLWASMFSLQQYE